MLVRSMIAGTALLAFSACCTHRSASPTDARATRGAGPVRLADLKDEEGNTVTLRLDRSEAAKAQPIVVTDKDGRHLPVHDYPAADVCLQRGDAPSSASADAARSPRCQAASSVSDGAFIKFGTASCTCYTINERLKCYGSTCP